MSRGCVTQRPRRSGAQYEDIGGAKGVFQVAKKTYAQQYSQIYYVRLATLLPVLQAQARAKWLPPKGSCPPGARLTLLVAFMERLLDVKPEQLSCVIGTVYAEMEFKPNILRELASDVRPPYAPPARHPW